VRRMTAAGNAPQVKVYPGVGHFIHTDVPYEFARDTVDFIKTGHVNGYSVAVVDALVHGAPTASGGDAVAAKPTGLAK
jgi:homoserine O-acetyltransferase/O-succinyltransferase